MAVFKLGGVTIEDIEAVGVPAGHVLTADGNGGATWQPAAGPRVLAGTIMSNVNSTPYLHITTNTTGMEWEVIGAVSGAALDLKAVGVSEPFIVNQPCFAQAVGDYVFEDIRVAVYGADTGYNFAVIDAAGNPTAYWMFYFFLVL